MSWARWAALGWGFAEATLFFIVPDVLLTALALRDPRLALRCCLWALAGALAGGAVMYAWGSADPAGAATALEYVPGVGSGMIAGVVADLESVGLWALFLGPLTGTPYKIYAATAAGAGLDVIPFLLVSAPARVIRFALLVALTTGVDALLRRRLRLRARLAILLALWTAFYAAFFTVLS